MNSTDINTLKLILGFEHNKKKVHISCKNKNEGKTVAEAIANNTSELMPSDADCAVRKGFSYKDFTYHFSDKEHAEYFYERLKEFKNTQATSSTDAPAVSGSGAGDGSGSNQSLILVAGIIVVAVIGFMLWKGRK